MSDKYFQLAHAMQSGVKYDIETNGLNAAAADPKHLRTGVNSAMVEFSALLKLLIEKGVITIEEWMPALEQGMREEVERYEHKADPNGRIHFG